jgi:hypothetical protein
VQAADRQYIILQPEGRHFAFTCTVDEQDSDPRNQDDSRNEHNISNSALLPLTSCKLVLALEALPARLPEETVWHETFRKVVYRWYVQCAGKLRWMRISATDFAHIRVISVTDRVTTICKKKAELKMTVLPGTLQLSPSV